MVAPILDHMTALSDPTRCRMLLLLEKHELTVSELCTVLQLPQSTVSRHLKTLSDDDWVSSRRDGTSRGSEDDPACRSRAAPDVYFRPSAAAGLVLGGRRVRGPVHRRPEAPGSRPRRDPRPRERHHRRRRTLRQIELARSVRFAEAIVVDVEAGIQTESRMDRIGGDERAGGVACGLQKRRRGPGARRGAHSVHSRWRDGIIARLRAWVVR